MTTRGHFLEPSPVDYSTRLRALLAPSPDPWLTTLTHDPIGGLPMQAIALIPCLGPRRQPGDGPGFLRPTSRYLGAPVSCTLVAPAAPWRGRRDGRPGAPRRHTDPPWAISYDFCQLQLERPVTYNSPRGGARGSWLPHRGVSPGGLGG